MLVSIIMPTYNSIDYVEESIQSVCNQSYSDFELIIIDDGSTDGTLEKCINIKKKDKRIKVYSKTNEGICAARNYGMIYATGKYIAFCDNDDKYERDLIKDNLELAERHGADVVRWDFNTYVDGEFVRKREISNLFLFSPEEIALNYFELRKINDAVWNGLFLRTFLRKNGIVFDESMRYGGEDLNFSLNVVKNRPKIILNAGCYYNWFLRSEHSTTAKRNENFCDSMLINAELEYSIFKALGVNGDWGDIRREYSEYIYSYAKSISLFTGLRYRKILNMQNWNRS